MCGIIGATLNSFPLESGLLLGLKKLEYRGYDSAGVGYINNQKQLSLHHTTSAIDELAHNNSSTEQLCAIAHTRWATHGEATVNNAHPHHAKQQLAIVHNGIIENHNTIKTELNSQTAIEWRSSTDSEVIAHYLYYQIYHLKTDIPTALQAAQKKLHGSYAIAMIDISKPNSIYIMARESPLLIGRCEDGYYVASDPVAIMHCCDSIYRIPSDSIWEVQPQQITSYNQIQPQWQPLKSSQNNTVSNHYAHSTLAEIHSQPRILTELYHQVANRYPSVASIMHKAPKSLTLLACGSSYYCAKLAKYWLEAELKIPVYVELASEFRYRAPFIDPNSLVLTLSQSGETLDTLSALRYIKSKHPNIPTMSIGNQPLSTMAQESDLFWQTYAGTEVGVATTKVFTAQLFCLQVLLAQLGDNTKYLEHWQYTPNTIQGILNNEAKTLDAARHLAQAKSLFFLGRGVQYAIAEEACLKVQELAYIGTHAFAAGELKHGPLALIDEHSTCVVLISNDHYADKLLANIEEIKARRGKVLAIGPSNQINQLQEHIQCDSISLPDSAHYDSICFMHIVTIQLLAYHLANLKGCAIDKPRNLAKCVTVE